jgi:threonine synthase
MGWRMDSLIHHLQCTACGNVYPDDLEHQSCAECRKPLEVRYDLRPSAASLPRAWSGRGAYLWRYRELLPIREARNLVTLGEGCTPLLRVPRWERQFRLHRVFVKDEGQNPTGSFKARGLAVVVAKAKEMGAKRIALATLGNAGVAAAAYAAAARLKAHVFMPSDTPKAFSSECEHYGAAVHRVDGAIDHAAMVMSQDPDARRAYNVGTFRQPYRIEGKKTMGFELWEQMDGNLPDLILYPTGSGTGIAALWRAFLELEEAGMLKDGEKPRLVAVQPDGCAPIVKAFREKAAQTERWENPETIALGLRVPAPLGDALALRALYDSDGFALSVSDYEIRQAMREMAAGAGVFPAPEGAATLAALKMLQESEKIPSSASVVLFNAAVGDRYVELL